MTANNCYQGNSKRESSFILEAWLHAGCHLLHFGAYQQVGDSIDVIIQVDALDLYLSENRLLDLGEVLTHSTCWCQSPKLELHR